MLPNRNIALILLLEDKKKKEKLQEKSEVKANLASRKPKEQEEGQTRKLIVFAVGHTLI